MINHSLKNEENSESDRGGTVVIEIKPFIWFWVLLRKNIFVIINYTLGIFQLSLSGCCFFITLEYVGMNEKRLW